jgi:SAM-dependent methyltransferase
MELAEYHRMHALEERHWWFRAKRRMVYSLLERWGSAGRMRVLDVGCGTGITLRELPAPHAGLGLDPCAEALALCRERGLAALVRGSATEIPLADGSMDVVLALDIVEHIDDDVRALREIARVLRSGGAAILTVPAFPLLWSAHDEALHHRRRYTRRLLEERLARAGLAVRAGGYGQATVFPAAALLRLGRRGLARLLGRPESRASDVGEVSGWLNALAFHLTWEVPVVRRGRLPVWLSLVHVVSPAPRTAGRPAPSRARETCGLP